MFPVSIFHLQLGGLRIIWYQSFGYTQSFWVLLRHFIKQVLDNLDFLGLVQLQFRTNFLEEREDDMI